MEKGKVCDWRRAEKMLNIMLHIKYSLIAARKTFTMDDKRSSGKSITESERKKLFNLKFFT